MTSTRGHEATRSPRVGTMTTRWSKKCFPKSAAPKEMKSLARRAARPVESSVVTRKRRRPKTRAIAGSASSSEPPVCETPRDATGDLAEPRAAATDSLPVTTPTPTPTAAPREKDGASPTRVFLAPVEDAPHSEHRFLLTAVPSKIYRVCLFFRLVTRVSCDIFSARGAECPKDRQRRFHF